METESNKTSKNIIVDPSYSNDFESKYGNCECKEKLLNMELLLTPENLYHNIFVLKEKYKYYLLYCRTSEMLLNDNLRDSILISLRDAIETLYVEQVNNVLIFSVDSLDFLKKFISSLYLCYDLRKDEKISSDVNSIRINMENNIYLSVKNNTFDNNEYYFEEYLSYLKNQYSIIYGNSRNKLELKSVFEILDANPYIGMNVKYNFEPSKQETQVQALKNYIEGFVQKENTTLIFIDYYDSIMQKYHLIGFEVGNEDRIYDFKELNYAMLLTKIHSQVLTNRGIIDIESDDYEFIENMLFSLMCYYGLYLTENKMDRFFGVYYSEHGSAMILVDDELKAEILNKYLTKIRAANYEIKKLDFMSIYEIIKEKTYTNKKVLKP